ncbi:hypothetical protein K8353_49995, partial [Burkholderia contaminans]|nr:hypothetical protein [Burkholderia contaminans]
VFYLHQYIPKSHPYKARNKQPSHLSLPLPFSATNFAIDYCCYWQLDQIEFLFLLGAAGETSDSRREAPPIVDEEAHRREA